MITHALLLALVTSGPNQHPERHPSSAFVYAELPDVPAMLGAYEQAPVVRMVRDEAVNKAVHGALESFDIDLDAQLAQLGGLLGLPEDQAGSPVTSMVNYLRRLRSASVSLSLAPDASMLGVHATGKTLEAIAQVAVRIEGYRAENGILPDTLAELELGTALEHDGWGHPFAYRVTPDAKFYRLASNGADGKEGGEGFAADIVHGEEAEAGLRIAHGFAEQLGVLAILTFDDAANTRWAHGLIKLAAQKAGVASESTTTVDYGGASGSLERWKLSADVEFPVWTLVTERTLVIGGGAMKPESAIELAAGRGTPLASVPKFRALPASVPAATGVEIGHAFMRSEGMLKLVQDGGPETEALRELVERAGGETYARMHLVGERFVTEFVTTQSSQNYFGKSVGQTPVKPEVLEYVPEDAIAFYATTVDGAALYGELMMALSTEGVELQARVDELKAEHGIDLQRDLFANLSGGIVGYLLEINGITPGMALIAELKDPPAFTRCMGSLLELVSAQEGAPFTIKSNPYKYKDVECPKWTFSFKDGEGGAAMGGMMAPTPTVAIVKNRVVITLFSLRATKEIKRLLGDERRPHAFLAGASRPPATATVIGYMDWAELLGGAYRTGMKFAGLFVGMLGGESNVDLSKFPEASVFTHFFKPTVLYTRPIEGGNYTRMESSFGPETWVAFLGGAVAGGVIASMQPDMVTPDPASEVSDESTGEEQGDEPYAPSAESVATKVALGSIRTAIAVYRADTGKSPRALAELAQPTKNYPKGFFNGGPLPKDGWGRDYRYALAGDGASFRVWSVGADGVDQQGSGDDIASD